MIHGRAVPALLLLGGVLTAVEPLAIHVPVPLVRPGIPLPFQVQGAVPADVAFPATLRWRIVAGAQGGAASESAIAASETEEAAGELVVDVPAQVAQGLGLVAIPRQDLGPARLEIALVGAGQLGLVRLSAPLDSAVAEERRLQTALAPAGSPPDLAERLRRERLGEWSVTWPTPTGAAVAQVRALLATPGDPAGVLHDPVDDSVQPMRRHPGPGDAWAVVLRPETVLKRRWLGLEAAVVGAARNAGLGLVEVYPAGDPTATGITGHRAELAAAGLGRPLLVGIGAARAGAERLYRRDPGRWRGLLRVAVDADLADPARWQLTPEGMSPGDSAPPSPPLTRYADGPFVLVVGTGEHDTAAADNALLAATFRAAWAAHAHGLPPLVTDREFRASVWEHHRLVLIGSPRSNAVLADLAPALPAAWNDRGVVFAGRARHRQPPTFCAVTAADPRGGDRQVLVLDGTWPAAWTAGLPLSQAGDGDGVLLPAGR